MPNHTTNDKYVFQVYTLDGWVDVGGVKVTYETAASILAESNKKEKTRVYNKTRRAVLM